MADDIARAEKALEDAKADHEAAQERRQALRDRVVELEEQADAAKAQLREAHEQGADPSRLKEIRRERRQAAGEAADLREELSIVDGVVEDRRQAVEAAEGELALARSAVLLEEATEKGTELHEMLEDVLERWEELQALENTHGRVRSTLKRVGYDGPGPGYVNEAAGVHNLRGVLPDIEKALRRDRARRG